MFQASHVKYRAPTTCRAARWPPQPRTPAPGQAAVAAADLRPCRPPRPQPPPDTTARTTCAASHRPPTTSLGPQALALCRPERDLERKHHHIL